MSNKNNEVGSVHLFVNISHGRGMSALQCIFYIIMVKYQHVWMDIVLNKYSSFPWGNNYFPYLESYIPNSFFKVENRVEHIRQ